MRSELQRDTIAGSIRPTRPELDAEFGIMNSEELHTRFRDQYGEEYAKFLWSDFGPAPRLCPSCQKETLKKLWLGDPSRGAANMVWAKWYMWCQSCLRGIYCPIGTYYVPEGEQYIPYGDQEALERALPSGLNLIYPKPNTNPDREALQRRFEGAVDE